MSNILPAAKISHLCWHVLHESHSAAQSSRWTSRQKEEKWKEPSETMEVDLVSAVTAGQRTEWGYTGTHS